MISDTSTIGTLTKKIHCQPKLSVMMPPMPGPSTRRQTENRAEEGAVLGPLLRRVEVGDDSQRDREDGTAAQALEATERG